VGLSSKSPGVAAYHPEPVHLRRAILLFALVLGLTALAAAVSPSRHDEEAPVTPAVATPARPVAPRKVSFTVHASGVPKDHSARVGEHLLLTVNSPDGGLVTIPRLGRTATVSPAAPAQFDLLAPPAGRYDVLLSLGGGTTEPRRAGTLVTRP
jgi:hypothetical protein